MCLLFGWSFVSSDYFLVFSCVCFVSLLIIFVLLLFIYLVHDHRSFLLQLVGCFSRSFCLITLLSLCLLCFFIDYFCSVAVYLFSS